MSALDYKSKGQTVGIDFSTVSWSSANALLTD